MVVTPAVSFATVAPAATTSQTAAAVSYYITTTMNMQLASVSFHINSWNAKQTSKGPFYGIFVYLRYLLRGLQPQPDWFLGLFFLCALLDCVFYHEMGKAINIFGPFSSCCDRYTTKSF